MLRVRRARKGLVLVRRGGCDTVWFSLSFVFSCFMTSL
jgi:RNase P/RNase MRP subunit POP5